MGVSTDLIMTDWGNVPKKEIEYLRRKLIIWYEFEGRDYPWRTTRDPYKILIAEVMLRKTRADQVVQIFEKFIEKYPTIASLSDGDDEEILEITHSLGLQWRNRTFRELACSIISSFDGNIPANREDLIELPGIGHYVAGMYLSSSLNKKEWIVDTNVVRVFSRFFGLQLKERGREDKRIIEIAKEYADCDNPRQANYAIIDFAALVCKSKRPEHLRCPINAKCKHYISLGEI